jgi:hypothetical protein
MTSSGEQQEPAGQPSPSEQPAPNPGFGAPPERGGGVRLDLADLAVVAGALLYLVFAVIPWFSIDGIDVGAGFSTPGFSINGFDSGLVTLAFLLLLAAAVWAVLPALTDLPVPFPRAALTAGLAASVFLLTLIEWLRTFDLGFSVMALLTVLVAAATLGFALLRLLPEVRGSNPPGGGANAAQRAGQQAPGSGPGNARPEQRAQPPGHGSPSAYGPPESAGDRSGGFAPPPRYGPPPVPGPPQPPSGGGPGDGRPAT